MIDTPSCPYLLVEAGDRIYDLEIIAAIGNIYGAWVEGLVVGEGKRQGGIRGLFGQGPITGVDFRVINNQNRTVD